MSFGPKKFWGATVASELGEGEFPETFRERALGRPRRPWQAGRRMCMCMCVCVMAESR